MTSKLVVGAGAAAILAGGGALLATQPRALLPPDPPFLRAELACSDPLHQERKQQDALAGRPPRADLHPDGRAPNEPARAWVCAACAADNARMAAFKAALDARLR